MKRKSSSNRLITYIFLSLLFILCFNFTFIYAQNSNNNNNNNNNNNLNSNKNDNINIFNPGNNKNVNRNKGNTNNNNNNNNVIQDSDGNGYPNDLDLIISTLDGSIYSFKYDNGMLNWVINQGESLYSTSQSINNIQSGGGGGRGKGSSMASESEDYDEDLYHDDDAFTGNPHLGDGNLLIPNIDGSGEFYRYTSDGSIQKLSFTLFDIINSSPLLVSPTTKPTGNVDGNGGDNDADQTSTNSKNTLYIGSKLTTVIVVDSKTGKVIKTLKHDGMWEGCPSKDGICDSNLFEDQEKLIFTRSDYKVVALDPKSGTEKWNLSIGEYKPFQTYEWEDNEDETEGNQFDFKGSVEIFPLNNRYKVFVKKTDVLVMNSFWECMLPSPPVAIYASSVRNGILEKIDFTRKLSDQQFSLLPHGSSSTDLVPTGWMPTFIFDNYDGHFYITSNDKDRNTNSNSNNNNNNNHNNHHNGPLVIGDGSDIRFIGDGKDTHLDHRNQGHTTNTDTMTTNIIANYIDTFKLHFVALVLVGGTIMKRLIDYKSSGGGGSRKNNSKKTPKKSLSHGGNSNNNSGKKNRQKQKQTYSYEEEEQEEEGEDIEEPNNNLVNQLLKVKKNNQYREPEEEEIHTVSTTTVQFNSQFANRVILEDGNIKIGKLLLMTNSVLGTGSCGTTVFEGYLEGRKVAIKRMLKQFIKFADREVSLLLHSDEHINVVRYHAKEEDNEFIYLALSYCLRSLDQEVDQKLQLQQQNNQQNNNDQQNSNNNNNNNNNNTTTPKPSKIIVTNTMKRMIMDLLCGLSHLHSLNIIHRDIKPQNILVDPNNRVKISDMGLGKKLDINDHSLTFSSDSFGWQPAEYLNGSNKSTKKVDIFSMGCVIFYLVTGNNPFGGRLNREKNVSKGKFDLEPIVHLPELYHLVHSMIQFDPEKRPTIEECENHPFFWTTHKQMSFLVAASDYLEFEKPTSQLVIDLDKMTDDILGITATTPKDQLEWWSRLDQTLIDNIGKYRKYNGKSFRDLLRVIRNKFNHYRDLPPDVQSCLGDIPDGFLEYFKSRFPKIIISTYLFIEKNLKEVAYFKQYFVLDAPLIN